MPCCLLWYGELLNTPLTPNYQLTDIYSEIYIYLVPNFTQFVLIHLYWIIREKEQRLLRVEYHSFPTIIILSYSIQILNNFKVLQVTEYKFRKCICCDWSKTVR